MKIKLTFKILLMILALTTLATAGATISTDFNGTWKGENQNEIISINIKDGFIDVVGKDDASLFQCTGVFEEKNKVQCLGTGINHVVNKQFIYKTVLVFSADGKSIQETWEAQFYTEQGLKKLN